jgi:hypothetical protein
MGSGVRRWTWTGARAATALIAAGCGDDGQGAPVEPDAAEGCSTPAAMRLQPQVVGASWTYTITDDGEPPLQRVSTIEAYEDIGGRKAGIMGYRQRSETRTQFDPDPVRFAVHWSEDLCTSVVRHREQTYRPGEAPAADHYYLPSKLRVDESPARLVPGFSWALAYRWLEVNHATGVEVLHDEQEVWSVVSTSQVVTVPAGTFTTVHLHRQVSGARAKEYWFAPGVGEVRETGEETEELTAYHLPAP